MTLEGIHNINSGLPFTVQYNTDGSVKDVLDHVENIELPVSGQREFTSSSGFLVWNGAAWV